MRDLIGTTLGHYRIADKIGEGGMGEVYRAHDERLDRDVAVKVLPSSVAQDPERLARFEREAKLLASLSHQNVATLYGLEEHEGQRFLVMELADGETLAERIKKGPIPVDDALEYARQISAGLEAAHEVGIIHRDLKPANVMVSSEGTLKVLDFGLAKAWQPEGRDADVTHSPTLTAQMTAAGVLLGTAAYMSPEQARGKTADKRADIWAFGCVVYEMLSGLQAFAGETVSDTLASVLRGEPDWNVLPKQAGPAVRRLLRRCLEKDPKRRLRSVADAALELDEDDATPVVSRARRSPWWWWMAGALGIVALTVPFWLLAGKERRPVTPQYTQLTFSRGAVIGASFAADGQTVVYSAEWEGSEPHVYLRRLDSFNPLPLDFGVANVVDASEDGQIALMIPPEAGTTLNSSWPGNLAVASITGGGLREVAGEVIDAAFGPAGSGLAVSRRKTLSGTIEYPIGNVLTEIAGQSYRLAVSPDGQRVAFVDGPITGDSRGRVAVVDLEGRVTHLTPMWEHVGGIAWAPDSQTVIFSARDIGLQKVYSVTLDRNLECRLTAPSDLALMDVARDGRLLVVTGDDRIETWFDGPNGVRDLTIRGTSYPWDMSADGALVTAGVQHGSLNYEAFLQPTDGSAPVYLGEGSPVGLSPDGRWVAGILPVENSPLTLWPVGPGSDKPLDLGLQVLDTQWLPGTNSLIVAGSEPHEPSFLWRVDITSGERSQISDLEVLVDPSNRFFVSPDGNEIMVLVTDENLVILPLDGGEPRSVPGFRSGQQPAGWDSDRSIFVSEMHRKGSRRIVRVDLRNGSREPWREIGPADPSGVSTIGAVHVTPDGSAVVYAVFRRLSTLCVVEGW